MSIRLSTRPFLAQLAVGAFAVSVVSQGALAQAVPLQVTVGDTTTLQLDGNPSTGYSWVLQNIPQAYRELVTVDVLGYVKPKPAPGERPVLGAPQKFQVLVTGVRPGHVSLEFNLMRGGAAAPAKTQQFKIEVLDRAPKAAPEKVSDDLPGDTPEDSRDDLFADPGTEEPGGESAD